MTSMPSSRPSRWLWRASLAAVALGLIASPADAGEDGIDDGRARVIEAGRRTFHSWFNGWGTEEYALDGAERFAAPGTRPDCPTDSLVSHRGTHLPYAGGIRVHEAFVPRLERFESLVVELATETYGRAPRRILHRGAYNCRHARGGRGRVSEHAFGNALDLVGFDFGPLPRGATLPEGLHPRQRRAFQVNVRQHWSPRHERDHVHARFLHELTETLRRRPDVFRGIVGPPRPRHHDHLHLDAAPWRYAMYSYEPLD